jgi:putative MATE family efflux protein
VQDLTRGSIAAHIVAMAAPICVGMVVQTLYILVDLYFVARLGNSALAGVSAAGNFNFLNMALTQVLAVGTVALIAHAVGARDQAAANLVFNQSLVLAGLCAALTLAAGYGLAGPYVRTLTADAATAAAGVTYLRWFVPGLALQFAVVSMASALRGTGLAKPTMVVQLVTVLLNVALAPVLIAGVGTGHPLGVAGAGLATSLSIAVGTAVLAAYFLRLEKYVAFHADQWRPRLATWKRILAIGLPAGGEFAVMFISMGVTYVIIREFGAAAQAGYGVGQRVMQSVMLPAMAVAFAIAPVAGQNFGARNAERVRRTFRDGALIGSGLMLLMTLFCLWRGPALIGFFATDPSVAAVGVGFLKVISLNFVAAGLVFTCSGMFQGLGHTRPAILSSLVRLLCYVIPALILSRLPGLRIETVWYLNVAAMTLQALTSLWLLRGQLRERLKFAT